MRRLLPDVPHVQNADRVAAARQAIQEFQAELIVLDDGFQHRRIARDLDIVLLDALEPFGFGHVFPRGTLREPLAGLRRADVVVLSRAGLLGPNERAEIWRIVDSHAPAALRAETVHAPRELIAADGKELPLETIRGQSVAAFCGIGNPAGFRHTLETCGCRIAGFREFPDHHRFTSKDVELLADWSRGAGSDRRIVYLQGFNQTARRADRRPTALGRQNRVGVQDRSRALGVAAERHVDEVKNLP